MTTQQDWLSNYFGDDVAEDLEKTAQAHLLVKLAEAAGLDINQLSEQELQQLAAELMMELEQQGGQPGQAPQGGAPQMQMGPQGSGPVQNPLSQFGQPTQQRPAQGLPQGGAPQGAPAGVGPSPGGLSPEMAKEAQAKFEEADALGRVMAHAYVEELDKIASARETEKTAGRFGRAAKAIDSAAQGAGKRIVEGVTRSGRGAADRLSPRTSRAVGYGAAGAGAAAVGAGASKAFGKKEKNASAFEKLANDRALEILQTLGIDPSTGEPVQQDVGDQPQEPDFGQAVDARALQLLADAGYDPQQVATAYDQAVGGAGEAPQQ